MVARTHLVSPGTCILLRIERIVRSMVPRVSADICTRGADLRYPLGTYLLLLRTEYHTLVPLPYGPEPNLSHLQVVGYPGTSTYLGTLGISPPNSSRDPPLLHASFLACHPSLSHHVCAAVVPPSFAWPDLSIHPTSDYLHPIPACSHHTYARSVPELTTCGFVSIPVSPFLPTVVLQRWACVALPSIC